MGFFSGLSAIKRANRKLKDIEAELQQLTHNLEYNLDTPLGLRCSFNQLENDMKEFGDIICESGMSMGTYYIFMGSKFDNPLQIAAAFKGIMAELEKEIMLRGG